MFFIMTSTSNTPALFHSSCGSFIEAQTPLVAVNMTSERLVLSLAPREFKLFEATELEWTKMPLCLNECTFWMLLMIDLTGFLVLGVDLTRTLCTNVHMTATPHETSIQLVLRTSSCSGVARFSRVPPTEGLKVLRLSSLISNLLQLNYFGLEFAYLKLGFVASLSKIKQTCALFIQIDNVIRCRGSSQWLELTT